MYIRNTYANPLVNLLFFRLAGETRFALRFRLNITIAEQPGQTGECRAGRLPNGSKRASVSTTSVRALSAGSIVTRLSVACVHRIKCIDVRERIVACRIDISMNRTRVVRSHRVDSVISEASVVLGTGAARGTTLTASPPYSESTSSCFVFMNFSRKINRTLFLSFAARTFSTASARCFLSRCTSMVLRLLSTIVRWSRRNWSSTERRKLDIRSAGRRNC